jgi:hypothetical protein
MPCDGVVGDAESALVVRLGKRMSTQSWCHVPSVFAKNTLFPFFANAHLADFETEGAQQAGPNSQG